MCNRLGFLALPILALLGACAQNGGAWQKPGTSEQTLAADRLSCRDYARQRLNSRAVRHTETDNSRAVAAEDVTHNDDLAGLRRMLEVDRMRLERRFYDECMLANGYRQAE